MDHENFSAQLGYVHPSYIANTHHQQWPASPQPDPLTGLRVEKAYWYRRIIDEEKDTLFKPAPVGEGDEPEWEVAREVGHGLGFCPVVWVQNLPVDEDIDGDSDCEGVDDLLDQYDALVAQAHGAIMADCDPLMVCEGVGKTKMPEVRKGLDTMLSLPEGSAKYLEMSGAGIKMALELAAQFRQMILEVTQCVLEQPDAGGAPTATEIERRYSSMLSKADILREQYGERGVKPLLEMAVKSIRTATKPRLASSSPPPMKPTSIPSSTSNWPAPISPPATPPRWNAPGRLSWPNCRRAAKTPSSRRSRCTTP